MTPIAALYLAQIADIVVPMNKDRLTRKEDPTESFFIMLKRSMIKVNNDKLKAENSIEDLASGRNKDIHSTMIAMERADIEFRLLQQVRNKLLDGYNELFRMAI